MGVEEVPEHWNPIQSTPSNTSIALGTSVSGPEYRVWDGKWPTHWDRFSELITLGNVVKIKDIDLINILLIECPRDTLNLHFTKTVFQNFVCTTCLWLLITIITPTPLTSSPFIHWTSSSVQIIYCLVNLTTKIIWCSQVLRKVMLWGRWTEGYGVRVSTGWQGTPNGSSRGEWGVFLPVGSSHFGDYEGSSVPYPKTTRGTREGLGGCLRVTVPWRYFCVHLTVELSTAPHTFLPPSRSRTSTLGPCTTCVQYLPRSRVSVCVSWVLCLLRRWDGRHQGNGKDSPQRFGHGGLPISLCSQPCPVDDRHRRH